MKERIRREEGREVGRTEGRVHGGRDVRTRREEGLRAKYLASAAAYHVGFGRPIQCDKSTYISISIDTYFHEKQRFHAVSRFSIT